MSGRLCGHSSTYDEVDSTSDRAAALIREGTVELPMAVWARRQTRGRGRGNHAWWSDDGSLTFTLAIDPTAHGLTVEVGAEAGPGDGRRGDRCPERAGIRHKLPGYPMAERSRSRRPEARRHPARTDRDRGRAPYPRWRRAQCTDGHRRCPGRHSPDGHESQGHSGRNPGRARAPPNPLDDPSTFRMGTETTGRWRLQSGDRWNELDLLRDRRVRVDLGTRIVAGRGCGIDPEGALCLDDGTERHRLFGGQVLRS